jgi:hypothetical protein
VQLRPPSIEPVQRLESSQPLEPARPDEPASAIVKPGGFTLVEEDDVAFSLSVCREVHRIYGEYQDGELPVDDRLHAGLVVTVEMLAALSQSVVDGMPAMRITVAAAQTREMLAVMFGQDPLHHPPDREFRRRYRCVVNQAARALDGVPAGIDPPAGPLPVGEGPSSRPAPDEPATRCDDYGHGRSRLRRWFGRRRRQIGVEARSGHSL